MIKLLLRVGIDLEELTSYLDGHIEDTKAMHLVLAHAGIYESTMEKLYHVELLNELIKLCHKRFRSDD